ncbi:hypothetical protein EC968_003920 [Mortierella alpina]|nr:hypothetical protein EC968_003920 [Mortierella alpina]
MSQDESTTGSIATSAYEKKVLALRSHAYNISEANRNFPYFKFIEVFPELASLQQTPLHVAFPNAPATEAPPPLTSMAMAVTQRARRNGAGKQQDAQDNGAGAGAAAVDRAARRQSLFSMSHWHKWLAFFLVFAYLVIAKTITRATASASTAPSK